MLDPRGQDNFTRAYNAWVTTRSPEAMANLVDQFIPTINAELVQYQGSKELLRSRARLLTIKAIKTFDPNGSAKLNSWVVTNLKSLARYVKQLRPIHASEDIIRDAAELNTVTRRMEDELGRLPTDDELQDETGWNKKRIDKIRRSVPATVNSGVFDAEAAGGEDGAAEPATLRPSPIRFASDAVYAGLDDRDKMIYDGKLGAHGSSEMSGTDLARKLGVTPAFVSQRSSAIGNMIADMAGREAGGHV